MEKSSSNYKVGDLLIGNRLADSSYNWTNSKCIVKVVKLNEDEMIEVSIVEFLPGHFHYIKASQYMSHTHIVVAYMFDMYKHMEDSQVGFGF